MVTYILSSCLCDCMKSIGIFHLDVLGSCSCRFFPLQGLLVFRNTFPPFEFILLDCFLLFSFVCNFRFRQSALALKFLLTTFEGLSGSTSLSLLVIIIAGNGVFRNRLFLLFLRQRVCLTMLLSQLTNLLLTFFAIYALDFLNTTVCLLIQVHERNTGSYWLHFLIFRFIVFFGGFWGVFIFGAFLFRLLIFLALLFGLLLATNFVSILILLVSLTVHSWHRKENLVEKGKGLVLSCCRDRLFWAICWKNFHNYNEQFTVKFYLFV